jgi:predicted HTH transcriptional regulator
MQYVSRKQKPGFGSMTRVSSIRRREAQNDWYFLTNHACVLVAVAQQSDIRISEIADVVGITERSAHRILMDLVDEGYVSVQKSGRRNTYTIRPDLPLRRPAFRDLAIEVLLEALSRA